MHERADRQDSIKAASEHPSSVPAPQTKARQDYTPSVCKNANILQEGSTPLA
ncbi:hypothetical protein WOLCODRAFT_29369 [Wolfiporia cocos MD-104 SS10]|uniref:Uncharacterized protein n=1 Tax=Wolfiporia cocos (strain MD-104) TaxID=742152 RepID=A0A2H3JBX6_WOLCO|nr:hypothetical protein WOLCODRAFT_29369 [Wolfiporia cocos MD-104 SS10]